MTPRASKSNHGRVFLVGAGPGASDLITIRGADALRRADVVIYDYLVSPELLRLAPIKARLIYAGKRGGTEKSIEQSELNAMLIEHARNGRVVVRLKGGDPFIFGRGGEEIETLAAQGIPFQVVPGITAASGVASYAGIPLTHRDYAQACMFVTGHLKDGTMNLDWEQLARPRQTVVVYMGLHGLETLCSKLIEHGLPGTTPIAIVQQGTTRHQRVVTGTLADLPRNPVVAELHAPTLIIVGGVVSLREKLSWFHPGKHTGV